MPRLTPHSAADTCKAGAASGTSRQVGLPAHQIGLILRVSEPVDSDLLPGSVLCLQQEPSVRGQLLLLVLVSGGGHCRGGEKKFCKNFAEGNGFRIGPHSSSCRPCRNLFFPEECLKEKGLLKSVVFLGRWWHLLTDGDVFLLLSQHKPHVRTGHGCHCGHPHHYLCPPAGGRGHHLLLPEQVWPLDVHCCQPVWQIWTWSQGQRHGRGQGCLLVSKRKLTSPHSRPCSYPPIPAFVSQLSTAKVSRVQLLQSFFSFPSTADPFLQVSL